MAHGSAGGVVLLWLVLVSVAQKTCNRSDPVALLQRRVRPNHRRNEGILEHQVSEESFAHLLREQKSELITDLKAEMKEILQAAPRRKEEVSPSRRGGHQEMFESCGRARSMVQSTANLSAKSSCPASTYPIFMVGEIYGSGYGDACCPISSLACAGCAELSGTTCASCAGGYRETRPGSGRAKCGACVDTPGWATLEGTNCFASATSCNDTEVNGLSSNQACCKCGGGQEEATQFTYYVAPAVLQATTILGFPVPRTASKYSVNKDCQLLEHGMAINGETGRLEVVPGETVGRNKTEAFTVTCTITAQETAELTASATLSVQVDKGVSYGADPLAFDSSVSTSYAPTVQQTAGLSWTFDALECNPSDAPVQLASDGTLTFGTVQSGGVSDLGTLATSDGGICSALATPSLGTIQAVRSRFVAVKPLVWTSFSYEAGWEATVGQTAPTARPTEPTNAARLLQPSAYTGKCDNEVSLDIATGQASYKGYHVFDMDLTTGFVRLAPEEELASTFEATNGRGSLSFSCEIFALYQFPPFGTGPYLRTFVTMTVHDDTCWPEASDPKPKFASSTALSASSASACRWACRSDKTCAYYSYGATCRKWEQLCAFDGPLCQEPSDTVYAQVSDCAERKTCVMVGKGPSAFYPTPNYIMGRYCYFGENRYPGGLVFLKEGITSYETFWLHRRGPRGSFVFQRPGPGDYQNASATYMAFGGEEVMVGSYTGDLIGQVFADGSTSQFFFLENTYAYPEFYVEALHCDSPNLTFTDDRVASVEEGVQTLVVDDPSTETVNDFWLHPCQCAPPRWGQNLPVTGESYSAIPAGSQNVFRPPPFPIVTGELSCPIAEVLDVIYESEVQSVEQEECQSQCSENPACKYFLTGEILNAKQCRLFRACTELWRELGLSGTLYSFPKTVEVCAISDPVLCWHTTKRRQRLLAYYDTARSESLLQAPCLDQPLFEKCDDLLYIGGLGVEECSPCKYMDASQTGIDNILGKALMPKRFDHGTQLIVRCWGERYTTLVNLGETFEFPLTCATGTWFDWTGARGLARLQCSAYVQVVNTYYKDLDTRNWQELFFYRWFPTRVLLARQQSPSGVASESLGSFYVKPDPSGAPVERKFEDADDIGSCLSTRDGSLQTEACTNAAEQLMDGTTVASQFYQKYKRQYDKEVSFVTTEGLGNLLDLVGDIDCYDGNIAPGLVLSKITFDQTTLSGKCVVGAVDESTRTSLKTVELSFQIQNTLYQKCLVTGPCGAGVDVAAPCIQNDLQACDGSPAQSFVRGPSYGTSDRYKELYKLESNGKDVEFTATVNAPDVNTVAYLLPDGGNWPGRFGSQEITTITVEGSPPSTSSSYFSYGTKTTGKDLDYRQESASTPFRSNPATWGSRWVWTMGATLSGTDFELACPVGYVLQRFWKKKLQVQYSCVRLPSLGACAEQTSVHEIVGNAAARIDMTCGDDRGVQAIFGEYDAAGKWVRFRFRCCQIASNPVLFERSAGRWGYQTPSVTAEQGIYTPYGADDTGRPIFALRKRFCEGSRCGSSSYSLRHDADTGEWCIWRYVTRVSCVSSNVVHPLDEQLIGSDWQVVPVDSFDASSEGAGARVPKRYTAKRAPPLIRFESEDPAYAPECKDDSTPGTATFSQEEMNQVAEELTGSNPENPCGQIFSTPKTKKESIGTEFLDKTKLGLELRAKDRPDVSTFFPQEDNIEEEGEGSSWYEWNLDDVNQPGESGITYKNTKGCDDRQGERDKVVESWAEEHERRAAWSTLVAEQVIPWLEANPSIQVSFFGNGIEIPVGKILKIPVSVGHTLFEFNEQLHIAAEEAMAESANDHDCSSLAHGMARMFCDLHCIRDVVKKGDAAILSSLETGIKTIQLDMRNLFEFYFSDTSSGTAPNLLQETREIRAGIARNLRDMQSMVRSDLQPVALTAMRRALSATAGKDALKSSSNLTSAMHAASKEISALHATMRAASSKQLSSSAEMERRVAAYALDMNRVLRTETHKLGVYLQASSSSRLWQLQLSELGVSGLQEDVRRLSVSSALRALDTLWWTLRSSIDRYLDAYEKYLRSFRGAVRLLESYTQCRASFQDLRWAYTAVRRSRAAEQQVLQDAWATAEPTLGLMAAQISDTQVLEELAANDVRQLLDSMAQGPHDSQELCRGSEALLDAAQEWLAKGFFGQTVKQLGTAFVEMAHLHQRFASPQSEGFGAVLLEAQQRTSGAVAALSVNDTVRQLWSRWKSSHCAPSQTGAESLLQTGAEGASHRPRRKHRPPPPYYGPPWTTTTPSWWTTAPPPPEPEWAKRLEAQHEQLMENQFALHNESMDLDGNINQTVDNLQEGLLQEPEPAAPTPPPGACDPGVNLTGPVCYESQMPCQLTISNDPARAAAQGEIIQGCLLLKNRSQELFQYCNDASEDRALMVRACSANLSFQVALGAFMSINGTCELQECTTDTGFRCGEPWLGEDVDYRSVVSNVVVSPGSCVYIMQQPISPVASIPYAYSSLDFSSTSSPTTTTTTTTTSTTTESTTTSTTTTTTTTTTSTTTTTTTGRCRQFPASCLDIYQLGGNPPDGVYTLQVRDLEDNVQDTELFCDMTNGGWTLVGQIAGQFAITDGWLRAYHNESQLQTRTITTNSWASIPAVDMAVNCASEVRLSNENGNESLRWEMDTDREISTWWNHSAGRAAINAAPGHEVLVHNQTGANETCWQNQYGIMKLMDHGGSYPAATINDQGNTFPDDFCLAVGVLPSGSNSTNGFTQNGNGYDAPTGDTDWPNVALQGVPMLNVWLK